MSRLTDSINNESTKTNFLKAKNSALGIEVFQEGNLFSVIAHFTNEAKTKRVIPAEKLKSLKELRVKKISHRRDCEKISIDLSKPGDDACLSFSPPIRYFYNLVVVSKEGFINLLNKCL